MLNSLSAYFNSHRHMQRTLTAAALLGLAGAAPGCGVTEQEMKLAQQTYTYDLNFNVPPLISSIPPIPCTDSLVCANTLRAVGITDTRIVPICPDKVTCAADARLTVYYNISVANDPAFTLGIAQRMADSIRDVKMTYGVTSTVNVDIEKIDVYLGPNEARSVTAPGVSYLGRVGPIPKMGTLPDGENFLLIQDGSMPHMQFVENTKHPETPFTVLLAISTRLVAGDPIPKGGIEVRLVPVVTLLNR